MYYVCHPAFGRKRLPETWKTILPSNITMNKISMLLIAAILLVLPVSVVSAQERDAEDKMSAETFDGLKLRNI